jgi:hypothetical protein
VNLMGQAAPATRLPSIARCAPIGDREDYAREPALLLKTQNPQAKITVRDNRAADRAGRSVGGKQKLVAAMMDIRRHRLGRKTDRMPSAVDVCIAARESRANLSDKGANGDEAKTLGRENSKRSGQARSRKRQ